MSYKVDSLSLEQVNRVLRKIQSDMDAALAIGQNPDFKGRLLKNVGKATKSTDAITKGQLDAHNHNLSDLAEKDYESLSGKPSIDNFELLKVKDRIAAEDQIAVIDASSMTYKKVPASTVLPPSPATTVAAEQAFGIDDSVGTSLLYARADHTHGTPTRVDAPEDVIVDDATNGLVLKDTQGTPHYWRVTVSNIGALVITDIGTVKP